MVRSNNQIANGHFHKDWQRYVKTWFDQPLQKIRRKRIRDRKAHQKAPRPVERLRPVVRCPSARYNSKLRIGRGFSLQELKACNLNWKYARSVGIAADFRRRNKSVERLQANVQRLKEYISKMILFPFGKKKLPVAVVTPYKRVLKVNQLKKLSVHLKARIPTKEEVSFKAFEYLRKERTSLKLVGKRLKRKRAAEDPTFEIYGGKVGKKFTKKASGLQD